MPRVLSIHNALPEPVNGQAPDWVHLVPTGTVRGVDGRGPYSLHDAGAVIAASMRAGKLPIDENHATDLATQRGGEARARGWIVEMQARADGIWGRVAWTRTGQELMGEGAYRGISPVLEHTAAGEIGRVLRAGLTNNPNLPLTTLHHQQQESGMTLEQQLRAALGLPETADAAAIVTRVTEQHRAVSAHAAQLGRIAAAAGAAANADEAAIITSLQSARAGGDELTALRTTVTSLQTQLTEAANARARDAATAAIDAAMQAGKPIAAALREHYITRHAANPAEVQRELDAMPSLHAGGLGGRTPAALPAGATAAEVEAAAFLGLDPAKFVAARAA